MFTSEATSFFSSMWSWIYSFISIHPIGLNISLWQLFVGLFVFRLVLKLVLNLIGVTIEHTGTTYRTTSYHKKRDPVYDNWNIDDTNWDSDW